MPQLTSVEKNQVEIFAQRYADFIFALTEGDDMLRLKKVPREELLRLYKEIEKNPIEPSELDNLDTFIEGLEVQIKECRERNTPRDIMQMMNLANAAGGLMLDYMKEDYPRLAQAVTIRMTEIHHTANTKRLDRLGLLLPDGRLKIGNHVSAEPVGFFQPQRDNPNYFNPPDALRDSTKWRRMTFKEFKKATDEHLFGHIFFVADPPQGQNRQDYTAFELASFKHSPQGIVYEVRWEGTAHTEQIASDDLEDRSTPYLWVVPKP